MLGIGAEKLHADWSLDLVEVEIFARSLVAPENSFSRNEFSRQNVRAVFLAELAENFVGHSGHGREIKWKTGKPWERGVHVDLSISRRSAEQLGDFILHVFQFIEP